MKVNYYSAKRGALNKIEQPLFFFQIFFYGLSVDRIVKQTNEENKQKQTNTTSHSKLSRRKRANKIFFVKNFNF